MEESEQIMSGYQVTLRSGGKAPKVITMNRNPALREKLTSDGRRWRPGRGRVWVVFGVSFMRGKAA